MNKEDVDRIIESFERHYFIEKKCDMLSEQTKNTALLIKYIIELQQINESHR